MQVYCTTVAHKLLVLEWRTALIKQETQVSTSFSLKYLEITMNSQLAEALYSLVSKATSLIS